MFHINDAELTNCVHAWVCLVKQGRLGYIIISRGGKALKAQPCRPGVAMLDDDYRAGDMQGIAACMAEDVSYHDMIYAEPFAGRAAVVEAMRQVGAG